MRRTQSHPALAGFLIAGLLAPGAEVQADEIKIHSSSEPDASMRLEVGNSPILRMEEEGFEGFLLFDNFFNNSGFTEWRFFPVGVLTLAATQVDDSIEIDATKTLILGTRGPTQRYLVDSNDDETVANHIWYENTIVGTPTDYRMMQLTEVSGGSLFVDGPVTSNHTFDLAETFWEREAVEPGELVAIDPTRPDAVQRTGVAYQPTVLGVASTRPAVILGGGAFSVEALRRTWGDEIADEYQLRRPELELRVFADIPELADMAERLRSQSAFEAYLAQEEIELRTALADRSGQQQPELPPSATPAPESRTPAYEAALRNHQTLLFDRTVQRFFEQRFTAVALAGRVPVKVDASFGAIRPGDYLTSSPIPGVAMKATDPGPVVGTALEPLAHGSGLIQVFVHRGWYGGEGLSVAGPGAAAATTADAKDRQIADLRRRLLALEQRLDRLGFEDSALARSAPSLPSDAPSP